MTTYRVLVFGSTGTGKTSLCNELTGQEMQADSSVRGNTFETHTYAPYKIGLNTFVITDTVGLNETYKGTVSAAEAAAQLVNLLIEAKDGFSILVHVFRIPRLTESHDKNYKFFVKKMTQEKIPVILVATGCENHEPMSLWARQNSEIFEKDGYNYKEVIATCFAKGGRYDASNAPLRIESKKAVLKAIRKHGLVEPQVIYAGEVDGSFNKFLTSIWNSFVDIAGISEKYRKTINESGVELLKRLGIPKEFADALAKDIPELLLKGAKGSVPILLPPWLKPLAPVINDLLDKWLGDKRNTDSID